DDELTLAAADRDHRVDRLEARLERLVDALAHHDAGRLELERTAADRLDLPEAVDRLAERVDHAAEVAVADRHREHLARAPDRLALLDARELAEHDDTDLAHVEVEREAERAVLELEQLVGHRARQALDLSDAVGREGDATDLLADCPARLVGLHEAVQSGPDLLGPDRQLSHGLSPVGDRGAVGTFFGRCAGAAVAARRSASSQPASRRRASSSRARTVASTTSEPIWTRMPPTTCGSTATWTVTGRSYARRRMSVSRASCATLSGTAVVTCA